MYNVIVWEDFASNVAIISAVCSCSTWDVWHLEFEDVCTFCYRDDDKYYYWYSLKVICNCICMFCTQI